MATEQSGLLMINIIGPLMIALFALILALVIRQRRKSTIVLDRERVIGAQAEWRAPDGLANASLPRATAFTGTSLVVLVVVVLVAAGGGVLSWVLSQKTKQDQQETELLRREGVLVDGSVTRKWMTGGRSRARYVAYQYTAPDGMHSATSSVLNGFYNRVAAGAKVKVTYAASNPALSRVENSYRQPPWLSYAVFIPVIAILFVPIVVFQQKKLLEYGTPAAAVVERVSPIKGGVMVAYQFIGPNGDAVKGRCSATGRDRPVAGDTITIIYDPERPKRSSRYPLKYVKLADAI